MICGAILILLAALYFVPPMINHSASGTASVSSTATSEKSHHKKRVSTKQQDPNDIDHAPLYRVGQYYDSARYGRIKLRGIATRQNLTFNRQKLTTTINWAKICSNTPKTAEQWSNSASDYNLAQVSNPYTYLKVSYTVSNHFANPVTFGGLKQVELAHSNILDGTDELVIDDGQSENLAAHSRHTFTIHVLVDKFTGTAQPQSVRLTFAGSKSAATLNSVSSGFSVSLPFTYDQHAHV